MMNSLKVVLVTLFACYVKAATDASETQYRYTGIKVELRHNPQNYAETINDALSEVIWNQNPMNERIPTHCDLCDGWGFYYGMQCRRCWGEVQDRLPPAISRTIAEMAAFKNPKDLEREFQDFFRNPAERCRHIIQKYQQKYREVHHLQFMRGGGLLDFQEELGKALKQEMDTIWKDWEMVVKDKNKEYVYRYNPDISGIEDLDQVPEEYMFERVEPTCAVYFTYCPVNGRDWETHRVDLCAMSGSVEWFGFKNTPFLKLDERFSLNTMKFLAYQLNMCWRPQKQENFPYWHPEADNLFIGSRAELEHDRENVVYGKNQTAAQEADLEWERNHLANPANQEKVINMKYPIAGDDEKEYKDEQEPEIVTEGPRDYDEELSWQDPNEEAEYQAALREAQLASPM